MSQGRFRIWGHGDLVWSGRALGLESEKQGGVECEGLEEAER